jgi:hypothetical protein
LSRPGGGSAARDLVLPIALVCFIGASLAAEWRSLIRPDTGFLLDAAARVLGGERLYVDVVEINPPLIVWLNMGAVALARLLGASAIVVYRLGVVGVLAASLAVSGMLLRCLLPNARLLAARLFVLLAFVFFPLSAQDFGEREHLVLALLVPYLLLAATRSEGRAVGGWLAAGIGVGAGVAFALKPHFLLVGIGVELWRPRSGDGRLLPPRPETAAMVALLAAYGMAVVALTPAYFGLVALLAGPYNRFLHEGILHLLVAGPGAVLVLFALLCWLALRGESRHPRLWTVLALGTAACLLAGAIQQKGLRYHFYPAFGLAMLLLGLMAMDAARPANRIRLLYRQVAMAVAAATVAVVWMQNIVVALGAGADSDRAQFDQLVQAVRTRAWDAGVFVMSYHLRSSYPLINYSGAHSASRFPHLWILASEYRDELAADAPLRYHIPAAMTPVERYLNRAVAEDFRVRRPRLLIVFRPARDVSANGLRRLDYIAYFQRDTAIARMLGAYQLVQVLGDYVVYERLDPGAARVGPAPRAEPGTQDVIGVRESGVQLRLSDPGLLVAAFSFLSAFLIAAWRDRRASSASGGALG